MYGKGTNGGALQLTSLFKQILSALCVFFFFSQKIHFWKMAFELDQSIRNRFYCLSLRAEDLLTLEMVQLNPSLSGQNSPLVQTPSAQLGEPGYIEPSPLLGHPRGSTKSCFMHSPGEISINRAVNRYLNALCIYIPPSWAHKQET